MSDALEPGVDAVGFSAPERRSSVALQALARMQDAAAAAGKRRVSFKRLARSVGVVDGEESLNREDDGQEVDPRLPAELQAFEAHIRGTGAAWVSTPGLASSRSRFRRSYSLSTALGSLVRDAGWDHSSKLGSVMAKWEHIVGEQVAAHCVVESFDENKLIIRCDSTAWMKQLQLLLPQIERRIDEEVGPGVVKQTIVLGPKAPSWKKGPWSVSGRGPRDTYG